MTPKRIISWLVGILILASLAACATNYEQRKRESEAFRNLGEVYMGQKQYTKALRELLKAEKAYASDPLLQMDLGLVYQAKGRLDQAETHLKKAVAIKPDYPEAWNALGVVYLERQKYDKAIPIFEKVSQDLLYATPYYPLSNLGRVYYEKKAYKLSQQYYTEALKLRSNHLPALLGLSRTYQAMGHTQRAMAELQKAIVLDPRRPELYFEQAKLYEAARDYRRAYWSWQKVIELAPESDLAAEADRYAQRYKSYQ